MSSELIFVIDIVELIFCDKAKFQEITQKEVMSNRISWDRDWVIIIVFVVFLVVTPVISSDCANIGSATVSGAKYITWYWGCVSDQVVFLSRPSESCVCSVCLVTAWWGLVSFASGCISFVGCWSSVPPLKIWSGCFGSVCCLRSTAPVCSFLVGCRIIVRWWTGVTCVRMVHSSSRSCGCRCGCFVSRRCRWLSLTVFGRWCLKCPPLLWLAR